MEFCGTKETSRSTRGFPKSRVKVSVEVLAKMVDMSPVDGVTGKFKVIFYFKKKSQYCLFYETKKIVEKKI